MTLWCNILQIGKISLQHNYPTPPYSGTVNVMILIQAYLLAFFSFHQ